MLRMSCNLLLLSIFFTGSYQVLAKGSIKPRLCSIIVKKAKKMKIQSYSILNCLKNGEFDSNEVYDPNPSAKIKKYEIHFSDWQIKELEKSEQTLICDFELSKTRKSKLKITSVFCDIDG